MLVFDAEIDLSTGRISLTYTPACQAADHHVILGPLAEVASYAYSGHDCEIGNLGTHEDLDLGPGSAFFLVVGNDAMGREGSYGAATGTIERPEQTRNQCAFVRDLSLRCN